MTNARNYLFMLKTDKRKKSAFKRTFTGLLNYYIKKKTGHGPCLHNKELKALHLAYNYDLYVHH